MLAVVQDLLELDPIGAEVDLIAAVDLPEPQRQLLEHDRDMTGTLEAFTGTQLTLQALQVRREGHQIHRKVVLLAGAQPVEFGAIRIDLDALPPSLLPQIEAAELPLGGLLSSAGISLTSEARGFLRTHATAATQALGADGPLFGRLARLFDGEGRTLADVVEILPSLHERD